ncbi:hypothetical protein FB565_008266 [Actinoplanes lutulentus]|uniref:hypothetical protein n=1 Tax=Actinoplanes lutulentus TaxID=1287878 RepID=UPI000DB995CD|nr:hypothetical protein [Actinoplanes lutulentus]MBB2948483.1 hypothetical protein [Actinoplanes lutulentus]
MHSTDLDRSAWSLRPHFTPRQALTAEQLNAGLDDETARQRLLNQAIHGYGVVLGLGLVTGDDGYLHLHDDCLEVTAGLALDRHGRMLYWPGGRLHLDDLAGRPPRQEGHYTLSVHYAARPPAGDDCPPVTERSRWRAESVVFTLRRGCDDADRGCPHHPRGACVGRDEYLCRRTGGRPGDLDDTVAVSDDVPWLRRRPGRLVPAPDDDWVYDPDGEVAVPLACVRICDLANRHAGEHDHDNEAEGGYAGHGHEPGHGYCPVQPGSCEVRPFVYRNPLLYELADGCDVRLPRVNEISWQDWIDDGWPAKVPWADFRERIEEGLEIRFSRPVLVSTLHEASVFLTAVVAHPDVDYGEPRRVPTGWQGYDGEWRPGVEPIGVDEDLAWGVRLRPADDWLDAEVRGRRSNLFEGAHFELTVRGQLLRDECGRTLDARPVGARGPRAARPGGDFVSVFQVAARPAANY